MKKLICVLIPLLMAVIPGCSSDEPRELNTREYVAMDTVFSLRTGDIVPESGSTADIEEVFDQCEELTAELEAVLSATDPASDVSVFNAEVDAVFDTDPVFDEVLGLALEISAITDGAFDPTIGALTSLWNVKGGGPVPSETDLNRAMAVTGVELLDIRDGGIYKNDPGVKLDLGAIGKGYAAQKLAEELFSSGVPYGIISAGRTVGVFGEKPDGTPFKIGIADPADSEGVVGYLTAESGFVSVAGDYEQYFEADGVRYHHIIDSATGYPSDSGLSSVAVLSQNGAAADALSTALLVMGYDGATEFYNSGEMAFEAVFIGTDGSVTVTAGLADQFEMSETYSGTTATDAIDTASDTTDTNDTAGTAGEENQTA